jgi:nitroreductase
MRSAVLLAGVMLVCSILRAQDVLLLPKPDTEGGKPLMRALKDRRSGREFSARALPDQELSNLLWAAFGVNRPDGHRTAPSAMNAQETDLYVATAQGLFLYEAKPHALRRVAEGDRRAALSGQEYVAVAPVTLLYVADYARMVKAAEKDRPVYAAIGVGCIAQSVYLYAASAGLEAVVWATPEKPGFAAMLSLRPEQHVLLAHSVGWPKQAR